MNDKFKKMFEVSMKFEKGNLINGYSNDKDDHGGETVYGVTRKNFPNLKVWKSLDKISSPIKKKGYKIPEDEMEEIENVYYKNFFKKCNIDSFEDLPLAMQIFDFAINAGCSRAIKTLQKIMHIDVDGICGRQTISTANVRHHPSVREAYRKGRISFYNSLKQPKFIKGWTRRANECDKDFL